MQTSALPVGELADRGDGIGSSGDVIDINVIEVRLPCRSFRIGYKVAEPGEFSMTTELLLRLLRLVDGFTETSIADFFGFTNSETRFIVDHVEGQGYAKRKNGKVWLTEAGHQLFSGGNEPALFEVSPKQERFDFDLISFAPADRFRMLDEFELRLPELPMNKNESGEQASSVVIGAFRRFFQEFRLKRGGTRLEKQSLYTVDHVQAEQRLSTLVPVTISVRRVDPGFPETSLMNWRSGVELDDRAAIVQSCAEFVKSIRFKSDQLSPAAVAMLAAIAPMQLAGMVRREKLNAGALFKATVKQAGELRGDRPTVRIVGQLWTDANRVRFASALKYGMARSAVRPQVQLWLRPSVPYWGATKRISAILDAVVKQFAEEPATSIRSIIVGEAGAKLPFSTIFNGVVNLPNTDLPCGLEMFLVPSHLVFVAVHTPLAQTEGYPVPLGIISFDPEVVARAHSALISIIQSPRAVSHCCDWGPVENMLSDVRAGLAPRNGRVGAE